MVSFRPSWLHAPASEIPRAARDPWRGGGKVNVLALAFPLPSRRGMIGGWPICQIRQRRRRRGTPHD